MSCRPQNPFIDSWVPNPDSRRSEERITAEDFEPRQSVPLDRPVYLDAEYDMCVDACAGVVGGIQYFLHCMPRFALSEQRPCQAHQLQTLEAFSSD